MIPLLLLALLMQPLRGSEGQGNAKETVCYLDFIPKPPATALMGGFFQTPGCISTRTRDQKWGDGIIRWHYGYVLAKAERKGPAQPYVHIGQAEGGHPVAESAIHHHGDGNDVGEVILQGKSGESPVSEKDDRCKVFGEGWVLESDGACRNHQQMLGEYPVSEKDDVPAHQIAVRHPCWIGHDIMEILWSCADKSRILMHDEGEPPKYWCHKVKP